MIDAVEDVVLFYLRAIERRSRTDPNYRLLGWVDLSLPVPGQPVNDIEGELEVVVRFNLPAGSMPIDNERRSRTYRHNSSAPWFSNCKYLLILMVGRN